MNRFSRLLISLYTLLIFQTSWADRGSCFIAKANDIQLNGDTYRSIAEDARKQKYNVRGHGGRETAVRQAIDEKEAEVLSSIAKGYLEKSNSSASLRQAARGATPARAQQLNLQSAKLSVQAAEAEARRLSKLLTQSKSSAEITMQYRSIATQYRFAGNSFSMAKDKKAAQAAYEKAAAAIKKLVPKRSRASSLSNEEQDYIEYLARSGDMDGATEVIRRVQNSQYGRDEYNRFMTMVKNIARQVD